MSLAVAGVAALVLLHKLDVSVWFDETFSYGMATQPLKSFFTHWAWGSESNMFVYYLTLRSWLGALSAVGAAPTEVLLRLPSALFGVGNAVVVFLIGRRLFGRVAGVLAALLCTANFLEMLLAQNARSYSMQLFLLALSWLALFAALETNRARWWITYVIATVLSVYAQLFSGLVIASEVVALAAMVVVPSLWSVRVKQAMRPLAISLAAAFVLVQPAIVDALVHGGPDWIPAAHLNDVRIFIHTLAGNSHLYEYLFLGAALLAPLVAITAYSKRFTGLIKSTPEQFGAVLAVGAWLVVPLLISYTLTQQRLNFHLFYTRYLVVVVPPLCLLVAFVVGSLRIRVAQAAAALVVVAVAWLGLNSYYQAPPPQNFRDPVLWMQARFQTGDGIVCEPHTVCSVPIAYYTAAYPGPAHLDSDSPGQFRWDDGTGIPVDAQTLAAYETHHRRIFVIYSPLSHDDTVGDADAKAAADTLTADGYKVIDQVHVVGGSADTTISLFAAS